MRSWLACLAVAMLLLALSMEHVNAASCPAGYIPFNNLCYRIGGKDVYDDAVDSCASEGGRISTPAELDELEGEIYSDSHYWLPAWSDGDCDVAKPGSAITNREDCNCILLYLYVCIIEVCPDGYDYDVSLGCCYRVCGPGTYQEAVDACEGEGATLMTAAELDQVADQVDNSVYYWIPMIDGSCDIAYPGDAVADPQDCVCDSKYLYVCKWCEECPENYDFDDSLDCCFRECGPGTYQEALDACAADGGYLTTSEQLDHLTDQLDNSVYYWIPEVDGDCYVANTGDAVLGPELCFCGADKMYVCVLCEDLEDNDDCICTLHDDPLVNSCDNATIMIIGEEQWYRFTASDEYAACAFEVDFYLGVDQALEKMYVKLKNKEIWMYADGIREDNENAALKLYTDGNPLVDLPMTDMTGVVYSGDITVSYDAAENLATYESEHCEIKLEFRTSPKPILRATIGEKYDNDLKWLCGNFNDNTEDDYRNENGDIISNEPDRYIQISDYVKKNPVAMT